MKNSTLKPFIGKWKTYGVIQQSPFGEPGILRGEDSYEWFDRRDFVIHRVNVKMGRVKVVNSEVICFDPQKKAFAMFAFDSGKTAGIQYGRFKGNKWLVDGTSIRFRGEFNRAKTKLKGEWQYREKSSWKRWMTLELTRVS